MGGRGQYWPHSVGSGPGQVPTSLPPDTRLPTHRCFHLPGQDSAVLDSPDRPWRPCVQDVHGPGLPRRGRQDPLPG